MFGREKYYFATVIGQGWPTVFEPAHFVFVRRLQPTGTKWAEVRTGQVGPVLPSPRHHHERLAQRVLPDVGAFQRGGPAGDQRVASRYRLSRLGSGDRGFQNATC